jgi:hypothetical protein
MQEIPLTKGKSAKVDDADYKHLSQYKWYFHQGYAARNTNPGAGQQRKTVHMHNELIGYPPSGMDTDHINGDGADNRRANLRVVTHRQNLQNLKIPKSSIYPGVSYLKKMDRWQAYISINNKRKNLGWFKEERAAFEAYRNFVNSLGEEVVDYQ